MKHIRIAASRAQIVYLQEVHHTDKKIAQALNLTVARVCQLRKQYGIPVYTVSKDNYRRNRFIYIAYIENKVSKKELADKNGLSIKTITRIIQSLERKNNGN